MKRHVDQGAVLALIQMLHSIGDKQLGADEEDCSTDSTESCAASELSEEEQHLEGTSFNVDEASHSRDEGTDFTSFHVSIYICRYMRVLLTCI